MKEVEEMGADVVVNVRFDTSEIKQRGVEVLAYETAVSVENKG